METAVFGGGCFWCTEAIFQNLKGVSSVLPGYSGGHVENPTYEQVSEGNTGHAEATKIEFDPSVIKFSDLLGIFFATHDPTTPNRQGHDVGPQYRSAIFYMNEQQKKAAEEFIKNAAKDFDAPIVTEITPFNKFYVAENYHQNYFKNNSNAPYCQAVISPKVAKFRAKYANLLKS
jgi:peptide-methionine (S)-S-oxide reductase